MTLLVLRTEHITQHLVGLAERLYHEVLDSLAELIVPFDPKQPSVHYLTIICLPVIVFLELLPIPATDTLPGEALEDEYLARVGVLHQHANMVELRANDSPQDPVLHHLAREEKYVACLRVLY